MSLHYTDPPIALASTLSAPAFAMQAATIRVHQPGAIGRQPGGEGGRKSEEGGRWQQEEGQESCCPCTGNDGPGDLARDAARAEEETAVAGKWTSFLKWTSLLTVFDSTNSMDLETWRAMASDLKKEHLLQARGFDVPSV